MMNKAILDNKLMELLDVLDKDIENIKINLSRLDRLRGFVIKRDDKSLNRLLGTIREQSQDALHHERRRNRITKELALFLGLPVKEITLTHLASVFEDFSELLLSKKQQALSLTHRLKQEYTKTAILLTDCARFNNRLISAIFGLEKHDAGCYNSNGSSQQQNGTAFVNMKL